MLVIMLAYVFIIYFSDINFNIDITIPLYLSQTWQIDKNKAKTTKQQRYM